VFSGEVERDVKLQSVSPHGHRVEKMNRQKRNGILHLTSNQSSKLHFHLLTANVSIEMKASADRISLLRCSNRDVCKFSMTCKENLR